MQDIRVQSYKNINEFLHVSDLIINGDNQSNLIALKYLHIWCERRPENKIPRAIYITKCLLDAYFKKPKSQMALSFAISKFINSICKEEEEKNRFDHKVPLVATAKNINLPAYMIELRHDIVHNDQLIDENRLEEAFIDSIDWLIENFWRPQTIQIKNLCFSSDEIKSILFQYEILGKNRENVFENIEKLINSASFTDFIDILFSNEYVLRLNDDLVKSIKIWKPLINYFCERKQIDYIIESVFNRLTNIDPLSKEQCKLRDWCTFLLNGCSLKHKNGDDDDGNLKKMRINSNNVNIVNWPVILLEFMKKSICHENLPILRILLNIHRPKISKEKQEMIMNIVNQYLTDAIDSTNNAVVLSDAIIQELQKTSLCFRPFGM